MTEKNVWEKAIDILLERGHHKGSMTDPITGAVCAMGALDVVECGSTCNYGDIADQKILNRFDGVVPGNEAYRPIARWNDLPSTTVEDIILLFKELAHDED